MTVKNNTYSMGGFRDHHRRSRAKLSSPLNVDEKSSDSGGVDSLSAARAIFAKNYNINTTTQSSNTKNNQPISKRKDINIKSNNATVPKKNITKNNVLKTTELKDVQKKKAVTTTKNLKNNNNREVVENKPPQPMILRNKKTIKTDTNKGVLTEKKTLRNSSKSKPSTSKLTSISTSIPSKLSSTASTTSYSFSNTSTNSTLSSTPVFASPTLPALLSSSSSMQTIKVNLGGDLSRKSSTLNSPLPSLKSSSPSTKKLKQTTPHVSPKTSQTFTNTKINTKINIKSNIKSTTKPTSAQRVPTKYKVASPPSRVSSATISPTVSITSSSKDLFFTKEPFKFGDSTKNSKRHSAPADSVIKSTAAATAASKALYTLGNVEDTVNLKVAPSKNDKEGKKYIMGRHSRIRRSIDSSFDRMHFGSNGSNSSLTNALFSDNLEIAAHSSQKRHSLDLYNSYGTPINSFDNRSSSSLSNLLPPKNVDMSAVSKLNALTEEIANKTIDSFKTTGTANSSIHSSPKRMGVSSYSTGSKIYSKPAVGSRTSLPSSHSSQHLHALPQVSTQPLQQTSSQGEQALYSASSAINNLKRIPPPRPSVSSSRSFASSVSHLSSVPSASTLGFENYLPENTSSPLRVPKQTQLRVQSFSPEADDYISNNAYSDNDVGSAYQDDLVSFAPSAKTTNTLEKIQQEQSSCKEKSQSSGTNNEANDTVLRRTIRSLTNFSLHSSNNNTNSLDAANSEGTIRKRTNTNVSTVTTIVAPQPKSADSSSVILTRKPSLPAFLRKSTGIPPESINSMPNVQKSTPSQQQYQYQTAKPKVQQISDQQTTKFISTLRDEHVSKSKRARLKKALFFSSSNSKKDFKSSSARSQKFSGQNDRDSFSGDDEGKDDDDDEDEDDYNYMFNPNHRSHKLYNYEEHENDDNSEKKETSSLKSLLKAPALLTLKSLKKTTHKINDMSMGKKSTDQALASVESHANKDSGSNTNNSLEHEYNNISSSVASTAEHSEIDDEPNVPGLLGVENAEFDKERTSSNATPVSVDELESSTQRTFEGKPSQPEIDMYMIGVNTGRGNTKKRFDEDKPWKHHVDVGYITPQEKKRYEGIWVSNKNSYLSLLPPKSKSQIDNEVIEEGEEDVMLSLLVFQIWTRSHLSLRLLKRIYDMVDLHKDGLLRRKSFIVGMWLIDQCLYGKKLPPRVDDRVWQSVDKIIIGVNIDAKRYAKKKKKYMRKQLKDLKKLEKHNQQLLARQGK